MSEFNDKKDQQYSPDDSVDLEYSFTAKKKGMKIQTDGETTHYTSEKGSKSTFEFTDNQFVATIPQESDDEIFIIDYESISDVEFVSGFRKNKIDIHVGDKLYRFWTKDSVNSEEFMEFIADGTGAESLTVDDLLFEDEEVQREYSSSFIHITKSEEGEDFNPIPSDGDEAKFVFTDKRFLLIVPQDMDDKSFSVGYESINEIEYSDPSPITLYSSPDKYQFNIAEDTDENRLIKFVYDKIRGNKRNKLAEELNDDEEIEKITTAKSHGIEINGDHTKPEIYESKFVFTDKRFLAYIPQKEADKLTITDYDSIVNFEYTTGMTKNRIDIHKDSTTYKFWTKDDPSEIISFLSRYAGRERFTLVEKDDTSGTVRIEGWKDGAADINADLNANSRSKGTAFGVEGGPFFAAKTSSKASIKGDISGEISDNTYSTNIGFFQVYRQNLTLDSDIELDIHISDIDNIFKQNKGMVIEIGSTTFRIGDLPDDARVDEAFEHIKNNMQSSNEEIEKTTAKEDKKPDSTNDEDNETADKLRELKDLHEEGILTDEEFESKKEKLLDDF